MFKTVAEMKRDAKNFTWTMVSNDWVPNNKLIGVPRKVLEVRSKDIAFESPSGSKSYLNTNKAKAFKFEGNKVIIDMSDEPKGLFSETMVYELSPLGGA